MKFILYSQVTDEVIQGHRGEPEYGPYFVLSGLQRVLSDLGSVEIVRQPETEVDPIFEACRARSESCVFLPLAPAGKVPLDLECPTVPVVSWEFSTFPGTSGEDSHNELRVALEKLGRALALSRHSARVIAQAMSPDFQINAVPPPIPTRADDDLPKESLSSGLDIEAQGKILDTAAMNLQADLLAPATRPAKSEGEWTAKRLPAADRDVHASRVAEATRVRLSAGGVVYTAVLDPNDSSKNVSDLVTAFCWALRDTANATLILKVGRHDLQAFYSRLIPILHQLSPFECRVIVIPGFLPEADYEKLIRGTTYCLNASSSEGVCQLLMEFMSYGKPAIAPSHTAMSDYIDNDVAFVLRASRQLASWPNDPDRMFRTMSFRLDWESLREAYRQSYALATMNPAAYLEMSKRARKVMQEYAAPSVVTEQLRSFFLLDAASPADSGGRQSAPEQIPGRG